MAKPNRKTNWKRRTVYGVTALLSLSLALGALTACKTEQKEEEKPESTVSTTDTQLMKNGNFEFYSEMDEEFADKRDIINAPTSWSFTSGSPSSDTKSGILNTAQEEWDSYTKSSLSLISEEGTDNAAAIQYAVDNWDKASVYDRLEFYDKYSTAINELSASSDAKKLFDDYNYNIDFEDVQKLRTELGDKETGAFKTHKGATDTEKGEDTGVLMIHNSRRTEGVRGTGQYYTSSTTITLSAGTAAEVSVWVKTAELYHFYSDKDKPEEDTPVTRDSKVGGAYIGVTNTAGGTTLDPMQIKNIRTLGVEDNNGWVKYTVFVRASTFATSTFKIVLGLGQSSSSNRYESVDGYALFDDLQCTVMTATDYMTKLNELGIAESDTTRVCTIDSEKNEKLFDAGDGLITTYALDLFAGFDEIPFTQSDLEVSLTEELSGAKKYVSKVGDNRSDANVPNEKKSVVGLYSLASLINMTEAGAEYNGYLDNFFDKEFKGAFPFDGGDDPEDYNVLMLLSTNGAAYTATLTHESFKVNADSYLLLSFFVKTSEIRNGRTGASATIVDQGGNETSISAFDSTTLSKTDIDNNTTAGESYNKSDIYNGWVQCFFFIENATDVDQTFTLKLNYGTKSIANSKKSDYADGYAAFANFEMKDDFSAVQYGYSSTNDRAVKVSLSEDSKDASSFADASITSNIETDFATLANYSGVVNPEYLKSEEFKNSGKDDTFAPAGVKAGLLNKKYADAYTETEWFGTMKTIAGYAGENSAWWPSIFGDAGVSGRVANQPLVIMNTNATDAPSYGYKYKEASTTISASTYQKISMRVKLSLGAIANIYLIDTDEDVVKEQGYDATLLPSLLNVTYYYDDEGNICRIDPTDKDFKKSDILFYLENNGLYTKAGETEKKYYANLWNYEKDENGNLVTSSDTVAYYYNNEDGAFYAYYNEKTKKYTQKVENLPKEVDGESIVRHTAPESLEKYGSVITVTGTADNADRWIEVAFYIHTGNTEKSYRLEIWAGSRDGSVKIPANSYVFFDGYKSASASDSYETLLTETTETLKTALNVSEDEHLPETLALYSTYSFYDSLKYLRYDETTDKEGVGNLYSAYKQSDHSEKLVWLAYDNTNRVYSGSELPSYAYFLDYSAYDVTTEASEAPDNSTNDTPSDSTSGSENQTNIWTLLASILLAVLLVFALVTVIVRRIIEWMRATGRLAPKKKSKKQKAKEKAEKKRQQEKAARFTKVEEIPEEKPEPEEVPDENNPYNE